MPPRYVYWTIIVDGQPTAFRSGSLEDIMPTFNRLKEKQPNAELKWFQNGQLWPSRHDAQDFMRARGERGRAKDPRQSDVASGFPVRRSLGEGGSRSSGDKPEWKPKGAAKDASADKPARRAPSWGEGEDRPAGQARSDRKPEWKPKGTFKPKEAGHASGWGEKPGWKPKGKDVASGFSRSSPSGGKPEWKPKGTFKPKEEGHRPSARDQARSSFRPKSFTPKVDDGRTRASRVQSRNDKLEWKPASAKASTFAKAPADRSAGQAPRSRPDGPNAGFKKNTDGVASGFSRSQSEGSDRPEGKRKWVPKADYKKSLGIEAKKDSKWRPGGDHVDPKQKYKDAKKAKWTKFKANIRARSTKPRKQEE